MEKSCFKKIARCGLGAFLVVAGIGHLTFARKEFQAQVPDWVPISKDDTVVYSGFAEIALGTALLLARGKQRAAVGKIAAAFFVAVFPGNILNIGMVSDWTAMGSALPVYFSSQYWLPGR
ncbi:DoxX family protein [Sphingobacterium athyrii]|uniref:DoxX family protein n=1 Tax=Sphingobacterium athyrii TaxID=2152717 RepID=UPI001FE24C7A|nr:hypothetical protein [Sphingobacterium athyrii]